MQKSHIIGLNKGLFSHIGAIGKATPESVLILTMAVMSIAMEFLCNGAYKFVIMASLQQSTWCFSLLLFCDLAKSSFDSDFSKQDQVGQSGKALGPYQSSWNVPLLNFAPHICWRISFRTDIICTATRINQ